MSGRCLEICSAWQVKGKQEFGRLLRETRVRTRNSKNLIWMYSLGLGIARSQDELGVKVNMV